METTKMTTSKFISQSHLRYSKSHLRYSCTCGGTEKAPQVPSQVQFAPFWPFLSPISGTQLVYQAGSSPARHGRSPRTPPNTRTAKLAAADIGTFSVRREGDV